MAPGTPFTDVDKPLHLHITPGACSSEVNDNSPMPRWPDLGREAMSSASSPTACPLRLLYMLSVGPEIIW